MIEDVIYPEISEAIENLSEALINTNKRITKLVARVNELEESADE